MIVVTHMHNKIIVRGHAGYAEHGKDIVCAAISALTQTFIATIEKLTDEQIKYDISPGRADIYIENPGEAVQLLIGSFLIGCKMIADEYPEYIRIEEINQGNGLGLLSNEPGQRKEEKNDKNYR